MIKVLPWSCEQCLIPVNTLTLKGCSEIGAFGHSSNHGSRSHELPKYLSYKADFFFKIQKILWDSENAIKVPENIFCS